MKNVERQLTTKTFDPIYWSVWLLEQLQLLGLSEGGNRKYYDFAAKLYDGPPRFQWSDFPALVGDSPLQRFRKDYNVDNKTCKKNLIIALKQIRNGSQDTAIASENASEKPIASEEGELLVGPQIDWWIKQKGRTHDVHMAVMGNPDSPFSEVTQVLKDILLLGAESRVEEQVHQFIVNNSGGGGQGTHWTHLKMTATPANKVSFVYTDSLGGVAFEAQIKSRLQIAVNNAVIEAKNARDQATLESGPTQSLEEKESGDHGQLGTKTPPSGKLKSINPAPELKKMADAKKKRLEEAVVEGDRQLREAKAKRLDEEKREAQSKGSDQPKPPSTKDEKGDQGGFELKQSKVVPEETPQDPSEKHPEETPQEPDGGETPVSKNPKKNTPKPAVLSKEEKDNRTHLLQIMITQEQADKAREEKEEAKKNKVSSTSSESSAEEKDSPEQTPEVYKLTFKEVPSSQSKEDGGDSTPESTFTLIQIQAPEEKDVAAVMKFVFKEQEVDKKKPSPASSKDSKEGEEKLSNFSIIRKEQEGGGRKYESPSTGCASLEVRYAGLIRMYVEEELRNVSGGSLALEFTIPLWHLDGEEAVGSGSGGVKGKDWILGQIKDCLAQKRQAAVDRTGKEDSTIPKTFTLSLNDKYVDGAKKAGDAEKNTDGAKEKADDAKKKSEDGETPLVPTSTHAVPLPNFPEPKKPDSTWQWFRKSLGLFPPPKQPPGGKPQPQGMDQQALQSIFQQHSLK